MIHFSYFDLIIVKLKIVVKSSTAKKNFLVLDGGYLVIWSKVV